MATIERTDHGEWLVRFPYDAGLVSRIKRDIPGWARRWDAARRAWSIDPQYVAVAAGIVGLPAPAIERPSAPERGTPKVDAFDVYYLGRARMRESGRSIAYGMDARGAWRYVFEEPVLRAWFGSATPPDEAATLYDLVGASPDADAEALKRAIRAAMRQWHPDVCKEPDAAERFKQIAAARDVLLDPDRRARYDAGVRAMRLANAPPTHGRRRATGESAGYRTPLLCGRISGEAIRMGDRIRIVRITGWEDIIDAQGRALIASWPRGGEQPEWRWV